MRSSQCGRDSQKCRRPCGNTDTESHCNCHTYGNSNGDAHDNSHRDRNGHTDCDTQFDSNSDGKLYTQPNSKRKAKAYAKA